MAEILKHLLLLISTTIKHYFNGPPRPSWNLQGHIFWAKFISLFVSNKTIEEMQRASFSFRPAPVQAGVSPWVDLTVSTPSILDDECADYIPNVTSGTAAFYAESQASKEFKKKDAAFAAKIKNQNIGPKIWHDSFDRPEGRLQLYVNNEGLAIPYVSPMLAESLGNLPPLLLFVDYACTKMSYERMSEFVNRVTNILNEPLPPSSYNYINIKGELSPLKERHKKVFNWEKIGIVPSSAA
ncbi:hypothetical protein RhiirA4_522409 [Rhizophagus irregularis]|uniref:Uncharacterized protein n=1 Tax=Rhizophagus irregularis TaxID=588596 RepID=A0A2I1GL91_9GLOM|nr:hypothetical protein RhiirA4_522409 [Rhizophagus irregularis]